MRREFVDVLDEEVDHFGRDHDLHRLVDVHLPGHAGRQAGDGRGIARFAGLLGFQVGLENGLIFGGERRRGRPFVAAGAAPFAPQVGIFRLVEGLGGADAAGERADKPDGGNQVSVDHAFTIPAERDFSGKVEGLRGRGKRQGNTAIRVGRALAKPADVRCDEFQLVGLTNSSTHPAAEPYRLLVQNPPALNLNFWVTS